MLGGNMSFEMFRSRWMLYRSPMKITSDYSQHLVDEVFTAELEIPHLFYQASAPLMIEGELSYASETWPNSVLNIGRDCNFKQVSGSHDIILEDVAIKEIVADILLRLNLNS